MVFYDRKNIRLKDHDYSGPGYYFVTINVKHARCCLGRVAGGKIILNQFGKIVANQWKSLPQHYPYCRIDEFIVMPDHFHGILEIGDVRAAVPSRPTKAWVPSEGAWGQAPLHNLSSIIRAFKLFSAQRINALGPKIPFQWHRSYYDHIIRNEKSLANIRQYIRNNPRPWVLDEKNKKNELKIASWKGIYFHI